MKIDRSKFIEIKSDKKVNRQTVTINENGAIQISKAIRDELKENALSLQIRKDYKQILLEPTGRELVIRTNGTIAAKNLVETIDRRKILFPMTYKMQWEPSEKVWIGDLQPPYSVLAKKRAQQEELKGLVE